MCLVYLVVEHINCLFKNTMPTDKLIPRVAHFFPRIYKKLWISNIGLARNRFVRIKKATIHVFSCLIAYLIRYAM
jgi:hypothetical protein